MPNTNVHEEVAEIFTSAEHEISRSYDDLEADWQRINTEFKEGLTKDLTAHFAEGDTEELEAIIAGCDSDAT